MSRMILTSLCMRVSLVVSVCALFCGCVVPVRTAMKARNARGEGLRKGDALAEKVDLSVSVRATHLFKWQRSVLK
jgi:hypothetical protein